MEKPPLYSRSAVGGAANTPGSLLDKARAFSEFKVHQVELVRQALIQTSEDGTGHDRNSTEIAAAFAELKAAYDKLALLKWDSARLDHEEAHRVSVGLQQAQINRIAAAPPSPSAPEAENATASRQRLNSNPWKDDESMQPPDWIENAFDESAFPADDDDGDDDENSTGTHPLNANAEPFTRPDSSINTPPGFRNGASTNGQSKRVEINDEDVANHQMDDGSDTKPAAMRSLTSMSTDVSSLKTGDDTDGSYEEDTDTDSVTTASTEEIPPADNFDYVYTGGYSVRVSGGKETKGVVPKTVKHVLIDPSVKIVEEGAFQGCNVLETVTVPSTVEKIGDNAFRKCAKLKSVVFLTKARRSKRGNGGEKSNATRSSSALLTHDGRSSSLRNIGDWAFFNCSSLGVMTLPDGLETIGERAFQRCSALSITSIPSTLASLGENAFVGCPRETKGALDRWEKKHSSE